MVVDYLTRCQLTESLQDAFAISLKGASKIREQDNAEQLMSMIHGLDEESIIAAIKLTSFDVVVRNPMAYIKSGWSPATKFSNETITNIQIMVKRCLQLFDEFGPLIDYELVFPGAYTKNVRDHTKTMFSFQLKDVPIHPYHIHFAQIDYSTPYSSLKMQF